MAARSPGRLSAGIALVRPPTGGGEGVELLVVHPGGPFWAGKHEHAWSIPKGEVDGDDRSSEAVEATARREFAEETGQPVPTGALTPLDDFRIGSGKRLKAYLLTGEIDATAVTGETSNTFEMEWPPRSGRRQEFPEIDAARWVTLAEATTFLHKGQAPLVDLIAGALDEAR